MNPNEPQSSAFFEQNLLHGYSKTHELKLITINLASPERMKSWAEKVLPNGKIFGEITNANTLHYKTFKPQKGGLFCERIFGPLKDFECACGIRRRPSEIESKKILEHKQTAHHFCPSCDVEYTWSVIRRYQLGYIRLNSPVCHLWYLKTNPSYLSILMDIRRRDLESVVYCTQIPTIEYFWKVTNSYFIETSPAQIYLNWQQSLDKKIETKGYLLSFKKQIQIETEKRQKLVIDRLKDWQTGTENLQIESSSLDKEMNGTQLHSIDRDLLALKMRQNIRKIKQHQTIHILMQSLWKTFYKDLFIHASENSSKLLKKLLQKVESKNQTNPLILPHNLKIHHSRSHKKNPYVLNVFNLLETWKKKLEIEIEHSFNLLSIPTETNTLKSVKQRGIYSNKELGESDLFLNFKANIQSNHSFLDLTSFSRVSTLLNNYYEVVLCSIIQNHKEVLLNDFDLNHSIKLQPKIELMLNDFFHKNGLFWKNDAFYSVFVEYFTVCLVHQKIQTVIKQSNSVLFHSKQKEVFFRNLFRKLPDFQIVNKNDISFYDVISGLENIQKWKVFSKKLKSMNGKSNQKNVALKSYKNPKREILNTPDALQTITSLYKQSRSEHFHITIQNKGYLISRKEETVLVKNCFETTNLQFIPNKVRLFERKKQQYQKQNQKYRFYSSRFQINDKKTHITNNIYTVSYHYMWLVERDWKYFLKFNTAPINVEDHKITYYKQRVPNNADNSSKLSILGAGMIQKLLYEYEPNQLKEMAKQHQVLLPKLNNAVRYLRQHSSSKSNTLQIQKFLQKRDYIIRRLKLIRLLFRKNSNPNTMILSILPVLPPDLRPILKLQGQIAASDLNRLYQRIIYRNDRVKKFLKDPATSQSFEMKYAQRLLQEAVDNLIQNGKGNVKPETNSRGQPLKSLSEILKGKQGRFRQYLLGKRVDYSGRSVIVVGPKLKLYECGLPKEMALELFLPFLIKRILHYKLARTVIGAKLILKSNTSFTWNLLTEIMKNHPILLNRAPTLHRLGIQAFQPKLIEGRAILLHPLVCPAFNADFDGDQMAVHVPLTIEARTEAWKLMFSRNNLISPATGDPVVLPSQDMVLGCYYLTTEIPSQFVHSKMFLIQNRPIFEKWIENHNERSQFFANKQTHFSLYFSNFTQVLTAYQSNIISLQTPIWVKWSNWTEFGNDVSQPLEIRIDQYGCWEDIRYLYHSRFSQKGRQLNQYIRTTAGRVLMNSMIQNCLNQSK